MSDFTSILRNEIFRPSVTLIGPGALVSSPYIYLAYHSLESFEKLLKAEPTLLFVVGLLIFSTVGLLLDTIGSYIESKNDSKLEKTEEYQGIEDRWKQYWRIAFEVEPVGHRYLRNIVMKLKVELNFIPALLLSIPGIISLAIYCYLTWQLALILIATILILAAVLYRESYTTSQVLDHIRREILKGPIKFPSEME